MAPRRIVDTTGTAWELWEVAATLTELRERTGTPVPSADDGEGAPLHARLPGEMQAGWLAARSHGERRRIAPVPNDWMFMSDAQLRQLVEHAKPRVAGDRRAPTDGLVEPPTPSGSPRDRMGVRSFADASGTRWDVWEAYPMLRDRRDALDRRTAPRGSPDRRVQQLPGYGRGWLVFRSGTLRHRLHVIPDGWRDRSEPELRLLLVRAAQPTGSQGWS